MTIPGSGFAQTFIGMDAVLVRYLARKAKKLAAKWGGQCIVFIDEIDAVGMRRAVARLAASSRYETRTIHDHAVLRPRRRADRRTATSCWRPPPGASGCSRCAPSRAAPVYPPVDREARRRDPQRHDPGHDGRQGGGLALNQLLVVMDGIDDPPLMKRFRTTHVQHVPRRAVHRPAAHRQAARCACKPPKPRKEEIYFIGACNVPLEALDPALTRPGRMGRHIYFRTPTWEDRRDIFDLYLGKVAHERGRSTRRRARDELARITNGYSPAMIDQVCSLALTYAHSDGRERVRPRRTSSRR